MRDEGLDKHIAMLQSVFNLADQELMTLVFSDPQFFAWCKTHVWYMLNCWPLKEMK